MKIDDLREWPFCVVPFEPGSKKFQALKADIMKNGIKEPIVIAPIGEYIGVVDGRHRWELCMFFGHKEINVEFVDLSLTHSVAFQLKYATDATKIQKQCAYNRLLHYEPRYTLGDVARLCEFEVQQIIEDLDLQYLPRLVLECVKSADIVLANAIILSKQPIERVKDYTLMARSLSPRYFQEWINGKM